LHWIQDSETTWVMVDSENGPARSNFALWAGF